MSAKPCRSGRAGSYVLVLRNDRARRLEIGRLGTLTFERGWYAYVGSALNSLDTRVARHLGAAKKRFWHVDYLTPEPMPVVKVFLIRRTDRIEGALAARIGETSDGYVPRFGASDSKAASHLFHFKRPPHRLLAFKKIILDFRTPADRSDAARP